MKRFLTLIIIVFYFTLAGTPVAAQQVSLAISPPLLEVVIKPGKSLLVAYKIDNVADPAVLRARVVSFYPKDQFGNIELKKEVEGPVRFSLDNANFQLEQPFFLRPKESGQVLLRIRVPEGAPEGDYYYTLLVESDPSPFQEGASVSRAQARIGSNILITVSNSGRVDINGKIPLFETLSRFKFKLFGNQYRIFDSGDKVPVVLVVENSGANVIKPDGDINLRGPFGGKATYKILPQNILAMSQRQVVATPSAELDCEGKNSSFFCKRPASVVLSGFFLGKYRLSTSINFGEGSQNVSSQTTFIALPIKFGLGLIGVVVITTFIINKIRKPKEE